MKKCIICGQEIIDFYHLLDRYGNPPKYCESCRRKIRGYRKKIKPDVKREEISRWDNVIIQSIHLEIEKLAETEKENYDVYAFGGRKFGTWGGVSYSEKYLVFVNKNLRKKLNTEPVLIRKMKKVVDKKSWIYLVIDPAEDLTLERQYLYFICDYYKTTLKGLGRNRNLKHVIESEYELVLETLSSARSGRFGNTCKLIISGDGKLKIQRIGVA